ATSVPYPRDPEDALGEMEDSGIRYLREDDLWSVMIVVDSETLTNMKETTCPIPAPNECSQTSTKPMPWPWSPSWASPAPRPHAISASTNQRWVNGWQKRLVPKVVAVVHTCAPPLPTPLTLPRCNAESRSSSKKTRF